MFFNPLPSSSGDNSNFKVLSTAQVTITDQTDVANLAGNMITVNGSKTQTFLTGSTSPYNPDWSLHNLVIRPYMIATSIYRGTGDSKYNPDLFDPFEYSDLENPGDVGVSKSYIRDIKWYIVDSANNQTLIDTNDDEMAKSFSHSWTYTNASTSVVSTDKRTLVIKNNILEKDATKSILIKFAFHDPYADISIPVSYEVAINSISTGLGTSKASIESLDGNSFHNASDEESLRLLANYFNEGIEVDLDKTLNDATSNLRVEWFMKTLAGWTVIDPITQDTNNFYEIHRVTSKDENGQILTSEKTLNAKGGTLLIIRPGLVAGSAIFKLTITDDNNSDSQSSVLETIYDYSDPVQSYVHSSNGDKLYKGMEADGTTLSTIITYKGQLMEETDERYDTYFDYYWFRINRTGNVIEHIYLNEEEVLSFINVTDAGYNVDAGFPKPMDRRLFVSPFLLDYKATFSCTIADKKAMAVEMAREKMILHKPTEEDVRDASKMLYDISGDKYDYEESMRVAIEIKEFNI